MNAVIVNDFAFVNGGAGQIAFYTARKLAEKGNQVYFFSAVPPIAGDLKKQNIKVICLNQKDILNEPNRLQAAIRGIWNIRASKEMEALLRKLSPSNTVLHIHGLQKAISTSILAKAHHMGFRIIYHLHDYGMACPNLGFFDYKRQMICHKKAMGIACVCTNCDRRSYIQKVWRMARQLVQIKFGGLPEYVDAFIYISSFSLDFLKPYIPKSTKLFFVQNPLEVEKKPLMDIEGNKSFLFIGRLSPEKNPVFLARAAAELQVPVIFLGDGTEADKIKKINPKAKLMGWVAHERLYDYISKSRALIFPSILGETQGLSAFEAQAYGLPVIVSDTCAAREAIVDGQSGLLFRNNSLDSLKKCMSELLSDDVAKRMSVNSYSEFWNHHNNKDAYIDRLLSIYQKVLR